MWESDCRCENPTLYLKDVRKCVALITFAGEVTAGEIGCDEEMEIFAWRRAADLHGMGAGDPAGG